MNSEITCKLKNVLEKRLGCSMRLLKNNDASKFLARVSPAMKSAIGLDVLFLANSLLALNSVLNKQNVLLFVQIN